ncbi:MAG: hypothetical protein AAF907_01210, partial [Planctomycetota bacterium]
MASSSARPARSLFADGPPTASRWLLAGASLALLFALPVASARQETPPSSAGVDPAAPLPESEEVEKERRTAERVLTLLERNPRPGTALDRAYA